MDKWLDDNITDLHTREPEKALPILVDRCRMAATRSGLTEEEVEKVVGDIEEAIKDELTFRKDTAMKTSEPETPSQS